MNKKTFLSLGLTALALCSAPMAAFANDETYLDDSTSSESPDFLSLSIGYFDIDEDDSAAELRAEYRWNKSLFWDIKPWAGLEATTNGSLYAAGGLLADLNVADKFLITPSLGVGLYNDDGKDLGYPVIFRTQLEIGYELESGARVGLAASHLSNAHLDEKNPGTEVLNFYYHLPVNWF